MQIVAIEVVIHLHNNDTVAAGEALDKAFRYVRIRYAPVHVVTLWDCFCSISGFADSDYSPVLQSLVEAYKEKEEEAFYKCCDDSIFRTMDNEVSTWLWINVWLVPSSSKAHA